jgi:dihydroorotase
MPDLLLRGGRVLDPSQSLDATLDVLLRGGRIVAIAPDLSDHPEVRGVGVVDVSGRVVTPGLVDLHVHFREPGQTSKENIESGALCAARGGFTSVVCMPNTRPAIDDPAAVGLVKDRAQARACVRVFVAGAITKDIAGEELAPIGSLHRAGVVAITDDGKCIQNTDVMRRALEYARMYDLKVMDHCQDYDLVSEGVMHEGYWSTALGLRGWPAVGEDSIVARNVILARMTGTHIHCQHISSRRSVNLIRKARAEGVPISGEACPHHYVLTDAAVAGSEAFWKEDGLSLYSAGLMPEGQRPIWPSYDTNFKMNPPLRSADDRAAVVEGLRDGTLDILASDHAPHCNYEKDVEFDFAPFGILGLETQLALALTELVHPGHVSLARVVELYSSRPATLLPLMATETGTRLGRLEVGGPADVTVIDPDLEWTYDVTKTASKSANSPFHLWRLKGKAVATLCRGNVVWSEVDGLAGPGV